MVFRKQKGGSCIRKKETSSYNIYIDDGGGCLDPYIGHLYTCSTHSIDSHRVMGVQFTLKINFYGGKVKHWQSQSQSIIYVRQVVTGSNQYT